jgi:hypothetical protein
MRYWKGGSSCINEGFFSSPNDVYVAVKGGKKTIKNSVGDKRKEHF